MSKPGTLPLWATTGPKTTPSGGKQAAGFAPGERGAAQHFNWYMNLVYLWIVYINAGIWDGNLQVTGTLQCDGNITGTPNFADTPTFATGLVSSGTVKGTQLLYTTADADSVPALIYRDPTGTHTPNAAGNAISLAASTNRIVIPVLKPAGTILEAYNVNVLKTTSSARTLHARLYKCHADGTESTAGIDFANSDNSPGATYIAASGDPVTLLAGYQYYIVMTPTGFSGDTLQHADIFCTRPA